MVSLSAGTKKTTRRRENKRRHLLCTYCCVYLYTSVFFVFCGVFYGVFFFNVFCGINHYVGPYDYLHVHIRASTAAPVLEITQGLVTYLTRLLNTVVVIFPYLSFYFEFYFLSFFFCSQFAKLHPDKKQISVGVVGYPNVGKSSIINTLKKKKVITIQYIYIGIYIGLRHGLAGVFSWPPLRLGGLPHCFDASA